MIGIFAYENGLRFTGIVVSTEEEAWAYLDRVYGKTILGQKIGCNRQAFELKRLQVVEG